MIEFKQTNHYWLDACIVGVHKLAQELNLDSTLYDDRLEINKEDVDTVYQYLLKSGEDNEYYYETNLSTCFNGRGLASVYKTAPGSYLNNARERFNPYRLYNQITKSNKIVCAYCGNLEEHVSDNHKMNMMVNPNVVGSGYNNFNSNLKSDSCVGKICWKCAYLKWFIPVVTLHNKVCTGTKSDIFGIIPFSSSLIDTYNQYFNMYNVFEVERSLEPNAHERFKESHSSDFTGVTYTNSTGTYKRRLTSSYANILDFYCSLYKRVDNSLSGDFTYVCVHYNNEAIMYNQMLEFIDSQSANRIFNLINHNKDICKFINTFATLDSNKTLDKICKNIIHDKSCITELYKYISSNYNRLENDKYNKSKIKYLIQYMPRKEGERMDGEVVWLGRDLINLPKRDKVFYGLRNSIDATSFKKALFVAMMETSRAINMKVPTARKDFIDFHADFMLSLIYGKNNGYPDRVKKEIREEYVVH